MVAIVNNIYALTDQKLECVQVAPGKMHFELRADDQPVGTLTANEQGDGMIAKSGKHEWLFARSGFLNPKIIVKAGAQQVEYAKFTKHWLGRAGNLKIDSTTTYRFECAKFMCQERVWLDFNKRVLIRLISEDNDALFKIAVLPIAKDNLDMPLMTLLGIYLLVTR